MVVVVEGGGSYFHPPSRPADSNGREKWQHAVPLCFLSCDRPTDDVLGLAWGNGFVVVQAAGGRRGGGEWLEERCRRSDNLQQQLCQYLHNGRGGILAILHAAMYGLEIGSTSTLEFLFGVVGIRW